MNKSLLKNPPKKIAEFSIVKARRIVLVIPKYFDCASLFFLFLFLIFPFTTLRHEEPEKLCLIYILFFFFCKSYDVISKVSARFCTIIFNLIVTRSSARVQDCRAFLFDAQLLRSGMPTNACILRDEKLGTTKGI